MAYLVEFITIESLGKCYLRNGTEVIGALQKPLIGMMSYSRQIVGWDEVNPKIVQNVSDPIFTLHLDFKNNPSAPFDIINLPEEPKFR